MSNPLEFTLLPLTPTHLEIKIKNVSDAALSKTLVIDINPPVSIVTQPVKDAAVAAARSTKPIGTATLDGVVNCPQGWSVWARRESTDSTVGIALFNDMDKSGELKDPVEFAAGAEFIVRIPVNATAPKTSASFPYSYQVGVEEDDKPVEGKLELKAAEVIDPPDVQLNVNHRTPMMIPAGTLLKVSWKIVNGVKATLRGPLKGGNAEWELSPDSKAEFKMASGAIEVRVVGNMTYVLTAQVAQKNGPNVEVTRVLNLDIVSSSQYTFLNSRTLNVLPNGLIELDWAAWGVKQVIISVSDHSTRVINLTQQTLGRSLEGTGIMRLSARRPIETVTLTTQPPLDKPKQRTVTVVPWEKMGKPDIGDFPHGIAVIAPKIAVLSLQGLNIAEVGELDPENALTKLNFVLKTDPTKPIEWHSLAAADNRFLVMRRVDPSPDFEIVPFKIDGTPDVMPPVTLPPDIRNLALDPHVVVDFVGFGKRAYLVIEVAKRVGVVRRAFSIGFDAGTKKGDLRSEPLLEPLVNYRLVTFDGGLYALSTESGRMFRFNQTAGVLDKPLEAASAIKKLENNQEQCMVSKGMIVPVGRMLVVMSPTSVPSLASLEEHGLRNVLSYQTTKSPSGDVPQDLLYNPLKNIWTRCGHGLDMQPKAIAAFRAGEAPRLWAMQPDGDMHTLAVGSEALFAPDYVLDYPTLPLPPYLNKKRQFTIKFSGVKLTPIADKYLNHPFGISEFVTRGPVELPPRPTQTMTEYSFDLSYNEANSTPVVLQLQVSPEQKSRADADYFMELTFSGPNLATATSVYKRLTIDKFNPVIEELAGTRKNYSGTGPIEVAKPAKFD